MRRTFALLAALLFALSGRAAGASEPFAVAARGAALIDADSGRLLFGQNENTPYPMASTTKIMTALVALEHVGLDARVTAGPNAAGVPGTSLYLSEGETLSMEHMLYGLLLRSGNDAAVAIAEHVAGSVPAFCTMMNERAAQIGADAHFVNPHGLDADGHKTSALGLALILREAMKNPTFRAITGTQRKVIPWIGNEYSRVLENKNKLLKTYEGAVGGKTGYTGKAGRCLAFYAERNGLALAGAVLNCPTWFDTATAMLDYGFDHFRADKALEAGEIVASLPVRQGERAAVDVVAEDALHAAVDVGARTETEVDLPNEVTAPVKAGDVIGSARIKSGGRVVAECRLLAAADVEARSFAQSLRRLLSRWTLRLRPSARS